MDKLEAVKKAIANIPGPRPQFFSDPAVDRLLDMVVALAGETAVLYERLDSLERLVEQAGLVKRADIDSFQPDQAAVSERLRWNEAFVARVFQTVAAKGHGEGRTE
ncbi:MAG TPA: hypothetical protein VIK87_03105 [Sphingomonadales bacterium]